MNILEKAIKLKNHSGFRKFFAAYFYDILDKDLRIMFILKTKSLLFYRLYAK